MFDNISPARNNDQGQNTIGPVNPGLLPPNNPPRPPAPAGQKEIGFADDKKTVRSGRSLEDIFADTDGAASRQEPPKEKPSIFQPKAQPDQNNSDEALYVEEKPGRQTGKYIFLALLLAGFVLLLVGGYIGYRLLTDDAETGNQLITENEPAATEFVPSLTEPVIPPANNSSVPETNEPVIPEDVSAPAQMPSAGNSDTDEDGLTDAEEMSLGTNINNPDSDSDGLYDREEVMVYKTDPLNPDTDGDSYLDGSEVANGFNPKGAGKLYEIK